MKILKALFYSLLAALVLAVLASCGAEPIEPIVYEQGDEPYIIVFTEFPEGVVTKFHVDIEYVAVPSKGAEIKTVRYISNGLPYKAIYRADNAEIGELGKARVPLFIGENNIEFEVEDTNGKKARFKVKNKPIGELDWDIPESGKRKDSEIYEGARYTENRIIANTKDENVTREAVEKAAKSINGEIIGHRTGT